MIFNSFSFLVFLALTLCAVPFLPSPWRVFSLVFLSYLFYAAANPSWLLILVLCTLLNYGLARWIGGATRVAARRTGLVLSCAGNIGLLFFFKYVEFAASTASSLLRVAGFETSLPVAGPELPLGISFFIFESVSYSVDVYSRRLPPARRLWDYALFIAFFPHLVAGPIVRARDFLPQIAAHRPLRRRATISAMELIVLGMFKKVVIADNIGPEADSLFAMGDLLSGAQGWSAAMLFAVQIYCDFSGYTDIARGLARLFGFELGVNFLWPYFSRSMREFWRHWHISLSTWLRDYLYIPLGGSRKGLARMIAAMLVTWFLGGLWHGAAWHFVAWGVYHGLLVLLGAILAPSLGPLWRGLGKWGQIAATFALVCIGWVFFRAPDMSGALTMISRMLAPWRADFYAGATLAPFALIAALAGLHAASRRLYGGGDRSSVLVRLPYGARLAIVSGLMVASVIFAGKQQSFIYFQF
ncbi:MBOAT family O-acyltransferase [Desulfolutivibrio sulfoxidireducens]|uniref:MBOAT family O-acyltransferase n=1 Tax=Desulfolutivibrio sulfoxidireducens TaxID=2773299 RepID=UPI00159DBB0E|nr:MBOAT family O-acyltransferase [Desulfolutivibrio sulfoxidireducens]QLA17243.1 MBOAT family protein [Desulfolutivibrio sulfoxidireducens]